jgi:hypothetical protein
MPGMGETRNACKILMGKPLEKWALGRPNIRWGDDIKMNLKEVGCEDVYGG